MGYKTGFQVWQFNWNEETFNEILSIKCGKVLGLEICNNCKDLIVLESNFVSVPQSSSSSASFSEKQILQCRIFCLEKLAFKPSKSNIVFPSSSDMEWLRASTTFLCVAGSCSINIYSVGECYKLIHTVKDLWEFPTFAVSSGAVAYSSNLALQPDKREDQELFFMDPDFKSKSPGEKATEIVSKIGMGAGRLGEIGLRSVQQYFNTNDEKGAEGEKKLDVQDGVVVIRNARNADCEIIAHWKPHKHPISHLVFNSAQTLLFTCSTNGKTISAWNILNCLSPQGSASKTTIPTCVMTFSRGFTPALITDLSPSLDDRWLAVSTSRGTVHLYNIEPKLIAAAIRSSSSTSAPTIVQPISVTMRLNSRNPLQVARSLLPQSPDALGGSPAHISKPSSSVDNATNDLGFEEMTLDTTKNVFIVKFGIGKKYEGGVKYPLLLYDPFGKVNIAMIGVLPAAASKATKFTTSILIEKQVCRNLDFKETTIKLAVRVSDTCRCSFLYLTMS